MRRLPSQAAVPVIVLLLASVLGQGCVTMLGTTAQSITFTSGPPGAAVFVDGRLEGVTPLGLFLSRGSGHTIRIEKDGYRSVEIRIRTRKNWLAAIVPNLIWFPPLYWSAAAIGIDAQSQAQETISRIGLALSFVTPAVIMYMDYRSPKSSFLTPSHLSVTLEPAGEDPEPVVIHMERESFDKIVWISVLERGT
jgi:hypothetical protein